MARPASLALALVAVLCLASLIDAGAHTKQRKAFKVAKGEVAGSKTAEKASDIKFLTTGGAKEPERGASSDITPEKPVQKPLETQPESDDTIHSPPPEVALPPAKSVTTKAKEKRNEVKLPSTTLLANSDPSVLMALKADSPHASGYDLTKAQLYHVMKNFVGGESESSRAFLEALPELTLQDLALMSRCAWTCNHANARALCGNLGVNELFENWKRDVEAGLATESRTCATLGGGEYNRIRDLALQFGVQHSDIPTDETEAASLCDALLSCSVADMMTATETLSELSKARVMEEKTKWNLAVDYRIPQFIVRHMEYSALAEVESHFTRRLSGAVFMKSPAIMRYQNVQETRMDTALTTLNSKLRRFGQEALEKVQEQYIPQVMRKCVNLAPEALRIMERIQQHFSKAAKESPDYSLWYGDGEKARTTKSRYEQVLRELRVATGDGVAFKDMNPLLDDGRLVQLFNQLDFQDVRFGFLGMKRDKGIVKIIKDNVVDTVEPIEDMRDSIKCLNSLRKFHDLMERWAQGAALPNAHDKESYNNIWEVLDKNGPTQLYSCEFKSDFKPLLGEYVEATRTADEAIGAFLNTGYALKGLSELLDYHESDGIRGVRVRKMLDAVSPSFHDITDEDIANVLNSSTMRRHATRYSSLSDRSMAAKMTAAGLEMKDSTLLLCLSFLKAYTSNLFSLINPYIRSFGEVVSTDSYNGNGDDIVSAIRLVSAALNLLPFAEKINSPRRRDTSLRASQVAWLQRTGVMCESAFTSTTTSRDVGDFAENDQMRYHMNIAAPGTQCLTSRGRYVDRISMNRGEEEELYNMGTVFILDKEEMESPGVTRLDMHESCSIGW